MTELLVLDLVRKQVVTKQIVLDIGYDRESLEGEREKKYNGPVATDHYGRKIPKHAHGTGSIGHYTSSTQAIMEAVLSVYDRVFDKDLLIRRVNIAACNLIPEIEIPEDKSEQLAMFTDYVALEQKKGPADCREKKNAGCSALPLPYTAILKGMNLMESGTTIERNDHKAGAE